MWHMIIRLWQVLIRQSPQMGITRQGRDLGEGPELKGFNAIKRWVAWAAQAAKSGLVMWPTTAPLRQTGPGRGPQVGKIQTNSSQEIVSIMMCQMSLPS
jgi:hypothetical protein